MRQPSALPKTLETKVANVARRLRKPRRVVLRKAIEEHVTRHDPEAVTQAMNRIAAVVDSRLDNALSKAGTEVLRRTEW